MTRNSLTEQNKYLSMSKYNRRSNKRRRLTFFVFKKKNFFYVLLIAKHINILINMLFPYYLPLLLLKNHFTIRYSELINLERIKEKLLLAFEIYYHFVIDPVKVDIIKPSLVLIPLSQLLFSPLILTILI